MEQWYLSFDCAIKSFAFALIRYRPAERVAESFLKKPRPCDPDTMAQQLQELNAALGDCFFLAAGEAADLAPGRKADSLSSVERVRVVKEYLRERVAPALQEAGATLGCPPADSPELAVVVEAQMGPNAQAGTVEDVLYAYFSDATLVPVGGALKNTVRFKSRPDLDHCMFVEKYSSVYYANKRHATAVYYEHIKSLFDHDDVKIPKALRKDFADCVMQVLGVIKSGMDIKNAYLRF